jgi:hypothetical protein
MTSHQNAENVVLRLELNFWKYYPLIVLKVTHLHFIVRYLNWIKLLLKKFKPDHDLKRRSNISIWAGFELFLLLV